jgi:hypothetical protein
MIVVLIIRGIYIDRENGDQDQRIHRWVIILERLPPQKSIPETITNDHLRAGLLGP